MSIFKSEKIEKSLGVVLDVLFALVLLFSLFMTVSTLAQRENGVAGLRFGVIRSKSMEASELYVGDVVFVNREDQYDVGDVIVFYRAVAQYKNAFNAELVKDCPVWVHEVVAVSTDAEGRRTYLTKGTSNVFDDGYYVPQDFVLGKATPLPAFLNKTVGFVGSKAGIISLIICPCAAMTIYLVWELVILFTARDAAAETQGGGNTAKRTATTVDDALSSAAIAFDDATDKKTETAAQKPPFFLTDKQEYFVKTFGARLILADDDVKRRYSAIKNALLSISGVKARISKRCETFRKGRKLLAKLNVRGRKILLCLAIEPQTTEAKYFICDVSERGKFYRGVPSLFRVNSERGVKFASELIKLLAQTHSLTIIEKVPQDFAPPSRSFEQLLADGLIRRIENKAFSTNKKSRTAEGDAKKAAESEKALRSLNN